MPKYPECNNDFLKMLFFFFCETICIQYQIFYNPRTAPMKFFPRDNPWDCNKKKRKKGGRRSKFKLSSFFSRPTERQSIGNFIHQPSSPSFPSSNIALYQKRQNVSRLPDVNVNDNNNQEMSNLRVVLFWVILTLFCFWAPKASPCSLDVRQVYREARIRAC